MLAEYSVDKEKKLAKCDLNMLQLMFQESSSCMGGVEIMLLISVFI